ncbi:hypothetical protein FOMG_19588 [Fusarium oxysporum f. sp. melonis 26406]|uniref:Uncharacterized protein n=1 Tax=Fusarium oxysporum f. sp. melonis 26406 TaxID=1089452 RepID=W9ZRB0_FUSOX|nr:hypothetical protein FOMG_19588 [Fusarium oxysporum f. sp. melonis 26406]
MAVSQSWSKCRTGWIQVKLVRRCADSDSVLLSGHSIAKRLAESLPT